MKAEERPRSEYNIESSERRLLILALDTTTRTGSVAIVRDDEVVYLRGGDSALAHAQRLPADLMRACEAAGVHIRDIDLFAVAAGPGSFTGLRIGIATVQGLAMADDRRIVPVSTLEAIAASAGEGAGTAAWMDAQRGEVFAQVFDGTKAVSEAIAASPASVLDAHAGALEGVEFRGDGAIRYRQVILDAAGPSARIADGLPVLAGAIGLLAARHPERAVRPHAVAPIYVRRPDVEVARARRHGRA